MSQSIFTIEPTGQSKPVVSVPPLSIHKIVVGYVNDDCGNRALRWAEEIAASVGAQLIVTHSVPPPPGVVDVYYEELKEDVLQEAHTKVAREIREHLRHSEKGVTQVVSFEGPAKLMLQTATRTNADLVVVGSHGRKGIEQFLFGSVSESLAFRCTCPVLVCGPACEATMRREGAVLFASTPSGLNVRAAEYAKAIAERLGSDLIAMHTAADRPPAEASDRLWKEDLAKETMRMALAEPTEASSKIRYGVQYGDPAAETLAMADREGVALIVLGSGERVAGADHFTWHPVGQILRSAHCPVLIVSDLSK
ncbi:universal stress protein [Terriglobus roseus]|uniref:Nucleotide-binding universal stress protein, UspA family n=1 Tax=Terriglobus roseus TaxID=392734 RepID=A0A1H4J773_9BACT|nr:universal stress protein [Terriglobus roseus]SEB42061.1 Nucleotide-binding universal stress protein, UspA family [Terriglobus roseus]